MITDRRKRKYWARNISHCHNKISLNIARMFSTFRTVNTQPISITKTNHLTLFREMVVACCENHSKHAIQSLVLKLLVDSVTKVPYGFECSIEVKLPI